MVKESLDLLRRDGKVMVTMGNPLVFRQKLKGIFEAEKSWANFNYVIAAPNGTAKVSVLADCKILEDEPLSSEGWIVEGTLP